MSLALRHLLADPRAVLFWLAFTLILSARFLDFGASIDEPHSWRQYDTAQYIQSFHDEGIDLLHPSVAWMGGHKTLILEFPLPEAIAAVLYKVFGPAHAWARLVSLLFFAGSALYFRGIIRQISPGGPADLATLIYCALPLGYHYSRAIHIDPSALFFAHGFVHHALRHLQAEGWKHAALACLWAVLGFLVKAPYLFYLALPLAFHAWRQGQIRRFLRMWPYALPPVAALVAWQLHTHSVNNAAPDWRYIPEYHKFVDMWGWYFSTLDIRFMPKLWDILVLRLKHEVMGGFLGYLPFAAGLLLAWWRPGGKSMLVWLAGTVIYLLVFFPLNVIHNYYQLPFLAPCAFFIALAWTSLTRELGRARPWIAVLATAAVVVLAAGNTWRQVHRIGLKGEEGAAFANYLKPDPAIEGFGKALRDRIPAGALLIASYGGLDCRAPHLLYEARRYGWTIKAKDLNATLVHRLRAEGATHLALMAEPGLHHAWMDSLGNATRQQIPVPGAEGKEIQLWTLAGPTM